MIRSLPCSKQSIPARVAGALVFAVAAVALSAGAAVASSAEGSPSASQPLELLSAQQVEAICAQWTGVATELPIPAEYVPVCKLVNGWD